MELGNLLSENKMGKQGWSGEEGDSLYKWYCIQIFINVDPMENMIPRSWLKAK